MGCQPGYVQFDTVESADVVEENTTDTTEEDTENNNDDINTETDDINTDESETPTDDWGEPDDTGTGTETDPNNPDGDNSTDNGTENTDPETETDPNNPDSETEPDPYADSDNDGLTDVVEDSTGTDPNNPDTDGDGLTDGEETYFGTDPLDADSDDDGFTDNEEIEDGTDPLTDETVDDTGAWDWGEPTIDASELEGNYPVTFTFTNSQTGYVLCESDFSVSLLNNGSLFIDQPCVTPNGSVLEIEQNFQVYNVVDYSSHYGSGGTYIYGYLQGDVTVTVPNGSTFNSSGQYYSSGTATNYNNTKSLSLYWTVDIMTPNGLRTYQGSIISN